MKKEAKEEKRNKKGKKKRHIVLKIFLVILFILIVLAVIFAIKVQQNGGGLQGILKTSLGHDENTLQKLDKIYCVILGQSENLTDTIMLASYDPKTQEAALLSIPRDTFVGDDKNYASDWDKINALYQLGPERTLEAVRKITGINVQYYLKVDTAALRALVDEIGGVYFDVPIDMHYTDRRQNLYIDLKAGYQLLDGDKAEQVVRFRHNSDGTTYPYEYGGEDLGRMKTQRAFLTALLEQTIEKMDINTIFSFLDIAEQYVETNLDFNAIKDYVPYIIDFKMDNLKTATLPGVSEQAPTGYWIFSVYADEAEQTINELFYGIKPDDEEKTEESGEDDQTNEIDGNQVSTNEVDDNIAKEEILDEDVGKGVTVKILNGSGSSSKLSELITRLELQEYEILESSNTSTTSNTTIIKRGKTSEDALERLEQILGTDNITSGKKEEGIDVTIIIGTDFVM